MNEHSMTTRDKKKREMEAIDEDTIELLNGLVQKAQTRVLSFERKLNLLQKVQTEWIPGKPFPHTGYCFSEDSEEEEEPNAEQEQERKQKQLQNGIEYLEDELRQEQTRLLSWQQHLKQIQEEKESKEPDTKRRKKSDAKRHEKSDATRRKKSDAKPLEIQDFDKYVNGLGF